MFGYNPWAIAIAAYLLAAIGSLAWAAWPLIRGVQLNPGGSGFEEAKAFSEEARIRLAQHYSRMQGTLGFWKNRAELYKRLHYYSVCWTIPSSVVIPFLAQATTQEPLSKWLLTTVSAHTAILISFHRSLKIDANYKAFRQGESDFYDIYRRMMDRPKIFGESENEQLDAYFDKIENLRKYVRNIEIENLPSVEQATSQLAREQPEKAQANNS
jgi:hypothetical protein